MKISVAMAVHNEEKYLPYTLNSLKNTKVNEIVICLDSCTDKSLDIIKNAPLSCEKKIIILDKKEWANPTAQPFSIAAKAATGDVTYILGADIYADKTIFDVNWDQIDVQSFGLRDYPLLKSNNYFLISIQGVFYGLWEIVRCKSKGVRFGTGVYAYRKSVYQLVQHTDVISEDIVFLSTCQKRKLSYKYNKSSCLHLRPSGRGMMKFKAEKAATDKVPTWFAIWFSLRTLNLSFFKFYWKRKAKLKLK